jgi:uncharacterized protein
MFHLMIKPVGAVCNIDCSYCYYKEKINLYDSTKVMSYEILDELTRQYANIPSANFSWHGGEPTLAGLDFYRNAVTLQKRYGIISNTIQTNGFNLSDEWLDFFSDNNFRVGISYDGNIEAHDRYRRDYKDKGTYGRVRQTIGKFKERNIPFHLLCVVSRQNVSMADSLYRHMASLGPEAIQFIPLYSPSFPKLSLKQGEYGRFLKLLYQTWSKTQETEIPFFIESIQRLVGQPGTSCMFNKSCGDVLTVEHNGDVYSCDHFVSERYLLGNLMDRSLFELIQTEEHKEFCKLKPDLPDKCKKCPVLDACNGECPKNRLSNGENYFCSDYLDFFSELRYNYIVMKPVC